MSEILADVVQRDVDDEHVERRHEVGEAERGQYQADPTTRLRWAPSAV